MSGGSWVQSPVWPSFLFNKNYQQKVSQNIDEPEMLNTQSRKTRIPTQYIKDIQSSIKTADNRPSKSNLPPGIQIPQQTAQSEGKTEDTSQVELTMAAAVSKIEAINPQSLEGAMKRHDNSKWVVTI